MVLNLESGKLFDETSDVLKCAVACERHHVITELTKGVEIQKKWEMKESWDADWSFLTASYLAGRLAVQEAAPLLEQLQEVAYRGSCTSGGLGTGERFEGEVDPHSYETLTLRQVVQLSLRRLAKTPRPLTANQFDVQYEEYQKNHLYVPQSTVAPRAINAEKVKTGMKAEEVLDLLGGPDFVGYDTCEYDMDADLTFSLILKWDCRHVIDVTKKTPALWKAGFTRDKQIVK